MTPLRGARRRADGASLTFELEPEEQDDLPPERPGPDLEPASVRTVLTRIRTVLTRIRAWPRHRVVAAVAGVAVVVSGAAIADAVRDHARVERLAVAPGGVLDLAHEPRELWTADLPGARTAALMRGLLVVQVEDDPNGTDGGITLSALDPGDGSVRWRTEVDGARTCGGGHQVLANSVPHVRSTERIVCLGGKGFERVTVVGPDGKIVGTRTSADPDGVAVITPGGDLLRAERVGARPDVPALAATDVDGAWRLTAPLVTRDARLWLEEGATGETLWEARVRGQTIRGEVPEYGTCVTTSETGEAPALTPEGAWTSSVEERRARVEGCGLAVELDLRTGRVLGQPGDGGLSGPAVTSEARSLVDGGYVVTAPGADGVVSPGAPDLPSDVHRDDGSLVGQVPGGVLDPAATDGTDPGVLISHLPTGVAAYAAAGLTETWRSADPAVADSLVVRTRDVVVLRSGGTLTALDVRSGQVRWTAEVDVARVAGVDGLDDVQDVLTDGERVVLVSPTRMVPDDPGTADFRWTAVDLATGRTLWSATTAGFAPEAIAGRLYQFGAEGVTALR